MSLFRIYIKPLVYDIYRIVLHKWASNVEQAKALARQEMLRSYKLTWKKYTITRTVRVM